MTSVRAEPHADWVFRVAGGKAAAKAADLLPAVDVSWRRCLNQFNLDPARSYQPVVLDSARLKELHHEHAELVRIAQVEMGALYQRLASSGYALLLADNSGFILGERVDPATQRDFSHAGLIIGAEWSEQRQGTNGIGTCVTEQRPITIHRDDHFRSRNIGLSCSAAPICDSFGNIIAVLDASSLNAHGTRESQSQTVALVSASARLIEKSLFLRRHRADTVLRFHNRPECADLLHDGAIAVSAEGIIVAVDRAGLQLLKASHRGQLLGQAFSDVFGARCDSLRGASAGGRALWQLQHAEHGQRFYVSPAAVPDPIEHHPTTAALSRTLIRVPQVDVVPSLTLEQLAGEDPQMIRNVYRARRVADSGVSVLITGPTGSGKEAFAKAMHAASARAERPFVAINCAAIPESLIESELFGYAPGAFTGARREGMRGCIVQASGGTLFLDEIGDMPLMLQTRLLRVLEEQEVRPLGTESVIKVSLRVISASHRNLREMVARGTFREDLYYRLNGITLELPPLGRRRDRDALVRRCVARETAGQAPAAIELAALELLARYDWPGNVRELRNAIRSALAMCEERVIRVGDLPSEIRHCTVGSPTRTDAALSIERAPQTHRTALEHAERQALLQTIERNGGNMTRVAGELGLSRNTLYRKLKRHGIAVGAGKFQPRH